MGTERGKVDDRLFGMAAVELKLLTGPQVGELCMLQHGDGGQRSLAEVCREHGYLDARGIRSVLDHVEALERRMRAAATMFGHIAMSMRLLSREEVAQCVARQQKVSYDKKLGEIAIELGMLSQTEVERILDSQEIMKQRLADEAPLFGRLAVQMGFLTRGQLDACMAEQEKEGFLRRLGEICVEKGHLNKTQVKRVLERQQGSATASDESGPSPNERSSERPSQRQLDPRTALGAAARRGQRFRQEADGNTSLVEDVPLARARPASPPQTSEPLERDRRPVRRHSATSVGIGPPTALEHEVVPQRPLASPPAGTPMPAAAAFAPAHAAVAHAPAARRWARKPASGTPQIDQLFHRMVELGASDLHISSTVPPKVRKSGAMQNISDRPLSPDEVVKLLMEIVTDEAYEDLERDNDADFAYEIRGLARFRANYFVDRKGLGAVFRVIPTEILTPEQLGLPPRVIDLCWLSKGLVVVTGPTGSGKSTTLAAMVDYINRNRDDHIITVEDPIEFVHDNKRCLVNQREVGVHTNSFKRALKAALREDPDIVLVGEMRDLETISIAMETANTGHLVFGTLHTTTARGTIDRIIDSYPADQQEQVRTMLSESLRGVVAQVLCKKIGGGRVAAFETLMSNPAVANLIREGKTEQLVSVMQTGAKQGMQLMNAHFAQLVKDGLVEPGEAYLKAYDPQQLKRQFEQLGIQLPAELTAN